MSKNKKQQQESFYKKHCKQNHLKKVGKGRLRHPNKMYYPSIKEKGKYNIKNS